MSLEKQVYKEPGRIRRVSGPIVEAEALGDVQMGEVVRVGERELFGEVVALKEDAAVVQVYEETEGLRIGEIVSRTGQPLSVELGPGLLGGILDGVQRPLTILQQLSGIFISRGLTVDALPREKKWHFVPKIKAGDELHGGDLIGEVEETETIIHRIIAPPKLPVSRVKNVADEDEYTVEDVVATVQSDGVKRDLKMYHRWPVRIPRPIQRRLPPIIPLITGQRILDMFFPIPKGGTGAIPGGFGTGKTVTQHQLSRWSDSNIMVYVGCGERGNEMAEVLEQFPKLIDPHTGRLLMERTILVANVSNMPIAAREASVYTGITMAEYYRDQGYDVALMADSTSRWAEAMREISGRLEEMPGEEGYPAYLAARISEFYERAGRAEALGTPKRDGSITIVGAVSPPGGDFSEPITQNTLRVVRVFWALDTELAYRRHFPAIHWLKSYSLYAEELLEWFEKEVRPDWGALRGKALEILQREEELKEIVRLVGPEALSPPQRLLLAIARSIREDFLMQHAYHEVDTYSPFEKTYFLLRVIIKLNERLEELLAAGMPYSKVEELPIFDKIARLKFIKTEEVGEQVETLLKEIEEIRVVR